MLTYQVSLKMTIKRQGKRKRIRLYSRFSRQWVLYFCSTCSSSPTRRQCRVTQVDRAHEVGLQHRKRNHEFGNTHFFFFFYNGLQTCPTIAPRVAFSLFILGYKQTFYSWKRLYLPFKAVCYINIPGKTKVVSVSVCKVCKIPEGSLKRHHLTHALG